MAIRFVDKGPEDEPKAAPARRKAAGAIPETEPAALEPAPAEVSLPHAKPPPKERGRKAPGAAPRTKQATPAPEPGPAQASLDGLLPALPHAKSEPKPRGRKKAFG